MRLLETILVPVDFSDSTDDLLHYAAGISRAFGSEIILQSVLPHFGEQGGSVEKLLDMARAGAGAHLEDCRQRIEAQGAKVPMAVTTVRTPWRVAACDYARAQFACL